MRTNIVLDDELVATAMARSGATTKRQVVHLALRELVENRGRLDLRALRGRVRFREGYDHKALRRGDRG